MSIEFNMSLLQWINHQYQQKDLIITTKGIIDHLPFSYIFYVVTTQKYLWQTLVWILGKQMFLRHPPPFPEFGISDTAFEDLSRAHQILYLRSRIQGRGGKLTLIVTFPFLSLTCLNIFDFEFFFVLWNQQFSFHQ